LLFAAVLRPADFFAGALLLLFEALVLVFDALVFAVLLLPFEGLLLPPFDAPFDPDFAVLLAAISRLPFGLGARRCAPGEERA